MEQKYIEFISLSFSPSSFITLKKILVDIYKFNKPHVIIFSKRNDIFNGLLRSLFSSKMSLYLKDSNLTTPLGMGIVFIEINNVQNIVEFIDKLVYKNSLIIIYPAYNSQIEYNNTKTDVSMIDICEYDLQKNEYNYNSSTIKYITKLFKCDIMSYFNEKDEKYIEFKQNIIDQKELSCYLIGMILEWFKDYHIDQLDEKIKIIKPIIESGGCSLSILVIWINDLLVIFEGIYTYTPNGKEFALKNIKQLLAVLRCHIYDACTLKKYIEFDTREDTLSIINRFRKYDNLELITCMENTFDFKTSNHEGESAASI